MSREKTDKMIKRKREENFCALFALVFLMTFYVSLIYVMAKLSMR